MSFVSPSQLNVNNPGTWPIYYKVLAWIVLIAFSVVIYKQVFRTPMLEQQNSNSSQITTLKGDYKNLYQNTLDLPIYQKRSKDLVRILRNMLQYLPSQFEAPSLIDDIHVIGADYGIIFTDFKPEKDKTEQYYTIKPVGLSTITGFANFAQFSQSIASLDRILNVANMEIVVDVKKPDELQINSQLQTYVYTQDINALISQVQ